MAKSTIAIRGMSWGHCVMGVKNALAGVPGIKVLNVEIGKAEVEHEGALNVDKIKEIIDEEGYEVVSVG